jgi:hypothetical protein
LAQQLGRVALGVQRHEEDLHPVGLRPQLLQRGRKG